MVFSPSPRHGATRRRTAAPGALLALLLVLPPAAGCGTASTQLRRPPAAADAGDPRPPRGRIRGPRLPDPASLARLAGAWRHGAPDGPALRAILGAAEASAGPEGRRVLRTGRVMSLRDAEIILGSCWTYATAVYRRAGFGRRRRHRVFRSKKAGPYADVAILRPGDFLSFINHSYGDGEHSAIFVDWLDRPRKEALMLSYVGGRRRRPGGYRSYLLTSVYMVMRPIPAPSGGSPGQVWDGGEGASVPPP